MDRNCREMAKLPACANGRAAFLCRRKRTLEEARLSEEAALEAALRQQSGDGKHTVRNTDLERTGESGGTGRSPWHLMIMKATPMGRSLLDRI